MKRITQRKGDIGVTKAIHTFTKLGYDVSVPITESGSYDLVVDDGAGLHRVQVKSSKNKVVGLRRIHSNAQGYVVSKTAANSYDWLYILLSDGREFLRKECLSGRNAATVREIDRIDQGPFPDWYAKDS